MLSVRGGSREGERNCTGGGSGGGEPCAMFHDSVPCCSRLPVRAGTGVLDRTVEVLAVTVELLIPVEKKLVAVENELVVVDVVAVDVVAVAAAVEETATMVIVDVCSVQKQHN